MSDQNIYQELLWLFGPKANLWKVAMEELAQSFTPLNHFTKGDVLWNPGDSPKDIYFNSTGILGEFILDHEGRESPCIDFVPPSKLFWSGDTVLFEESTQTQMRVLQRTQLWSISMAEMMEILARHEIHAHAPSVMIQHQLRILSDRVREVLTTEPTERLRYALERHPFLLHAVPRQDLGSYLGVSRATLFRVINKLYNL